MNKHIDIGVRSLYASVCVILFCLGFMANTQTAAFITAENYTALIQTTSLIFVGVSGLYLFKYFHFYSQHVLSSWLKPAGVFSLVVFLPTWTDALAIFTAAPF